MNECEHADKVSIRGIALRAGVSGVIREGGSEPVHDAETMKSRLKAAAGFVAEHPGISRVSILRDLVAAVQHLFLRAEANRDQIGLDFFNEEDRNRMMDLVVDTVLNIDGGKT